MRGARLKRLVVGSAGAIGLALVLWACAPAYRGTPVLEPLVIEDHQTALGQRVFFSKCHQCHPGGGAGIGPALTTVSLPDWLVRFQVRNGLGQMPAFNKEEISPEELDGVVAYLNHLRERLVTSEAEVPAEDR
jgi:mono/diheme cytochrome c family protein